MEKEKNLKHVKKLKHRYDTLKAYVMVKSKKGNNENEWVNGDYKASMKGMKVDKDGRMPSKKDDLICMYNDIKHCDEAVMKEFDNLVKNNMFEE